MLKRKFKNKIGKGIRLSISSTIIVFVLMMMAQSGQAIEVTTTQNPEEGTGTYLALGDSLAVGIGATNPQLFGYVGQFNNFLQLDLTNLAKVGQTSDSFISDGQLQSALTTINDRKADVQVVTLDIGANDLFSLLGVGGACASPINPAICQPAVENTLTHFATNYRFILNNLTTALAKKHGDKNILVMTYYNPFGGTGSPLKPFVDNALLGQDKKIDCSAASEPANNGLNDIISCIGSSYGAEVVDVYPLIDDQALSLTHIAEGNIHPNNEGYAIIARGFIKAQQLHDDEEN